MATQPQWEPSEQDMTDSRIIDFTRSAMEHTGIQFPDYHSLYRWSIEQPASFWRLLWEYFAVAPELPEYSPIEREMPGTKWFPGATLNYLDLIARHKADDTPAITAVSEDAPDRTITWKELHARTAALAATLRDLGVEPGDRVVGYLPNIPEAVIGFLATASLGAIWAACGQDYPAAAAADRLGQLDPKVLLTADGYRYSGKLFDRSSEVASLRAVLSGLRAVILVSRYSTPKQTFGVWDWDAATGGEHRLQPVRVDFSYPLWIVFSSGTTGLPKGIMHSHGGVVLEHLKALGLHNDIGPTDAFFWYTSPSWMMWNYQVSALLLGARIVCYDGSPTHPEVAALWRIAARTGATLFGTSPGYLLAGIKAGATPDPAALRTVGISGSTLAPSSSLWLQDHLGPDVQVSSISGGTDVVSAFVGGTRTVPVWPGELSAPYLGVALDAYDEQGNSVRGAVGELVITAPMPSMPIGFWRDPDGSRYRAAYFDVYPGVWRHGDWITVTDRGSVIVHGRSDSTLNRNGIRMGSADIYQAVEGLPEIAEALVLGIEQPDGGYWMPLFTLLAPGLELDEPLCDRIRETIRTKVSPRHVPDEVIAAPGIPHTRTGKKLEVPIKRLLQGADPSTVVDRSAVDVPELLDWYAGFAGNSRS